MKDASIETLNSTITSESIEPFAAHLIGRWFVKVEQAKLTGDIFKIEDAYGNFWMGLAGLRKISVACSEAVHFGMALTNHTIKVANAIQKDLGIDPMQHPDWKF